MVITPAVVPLAGAPYSAISARWFVREYKLWLYGYIR